MVSLESANLPSHQVLGGLVLCAINKCNKCDSRNLIDWKLVNKTTVNFLNIRTPKKIVVITLKFKLCGSTIE